MSFKSFNFHPGIMAALSEAGYEDPTPIQEKAIPYVLQGRDVIGLAQTGTGKTAAFALPILQMLADRPRGALRAMVISPTRELAEQTCQAFTQLGGRLGLRSLAVYGGVGMDQQISRLRKGVEIVVGCPGRMLDHLWKGTLDPTRIEILVIDEADRLLDMGFLPSLRMILECILQPKQTLLFSATMPDAIRKLVREVVKDPVTVQVDMRTPASTVTHALFPVSDDRKTQLLRRILRETQTESVLVFTRTKHRAERLGRELERSGLPAASLRGDMSQPQRQTVMENFRSGSLKIMVATDIASRGIDVSGISHVINYDMPEDIDAYIHRIGRTGRINNQGVAFSFVTPKDGTAIRHLETLLKCKLERRVLPDFDYTSSIPARPHRPTTRRVHGRRLATAGPTVRMPA
jgi:ATP-dependent RNA helicase RhlE